MSKYPKDVVKRRELAELDFEEFMVKSHAMRRKKKQSLGTNRFENQEETDEA